MYINWADQTFDSLILIIVAENQKSAGLLFYENWSPNVLQFGNAPAFNASEHVNEWGIL